MAVELAVIRNEGYPLLRFQNRNRHAVLRQNKGQGQSNRTCAATVALSLLMEISILAA